MVKIASRRTLALEVIKLNPLVAPVEPRLENNGIETPEPAPGTVM
jgi:hypothetical protein